MDARLVAVALTALLAPSASLGQQPSLREPLYPGAAPPPIAAEPLPPPAPSAQPSAPASSPPSSEASPPAAVAPASTPSTGAPTSPPLSALTGRVFCEQPGTVRLADPDAVAEPY